MKLATRARSPRPAFTLVELLVVLAIISVLIALTAAGLFKTRERQKVNSTKDQLNKLQQSLDSEYDRVVQRCALDSANGKIPQPVLVFADNDPNRAKAVWTAFNLKREFPETFAEAVTPTSLQDSTGATVYALQPLTTFLPVAPVAATSGAGPEWEESGALLYLILAKKAVNGNSAMSVSADDLSQAAMRPASFGVNGATKLQTFADTWGNSVGFRRWYGSQAGDSAAVQAPPYVGSVPNQFNPANLDPLDTRNLVLGWNPDLSVPTKKSLMNTNFAFNGQNRTATVYSVGKERPITVPPRYPSTTIWGYTLRRYGN